MSSSSSSFVIDNYPYGDTYPSSSCTSSDSSSEDSYVSRQKRSRKQRAFVSNDQKDPTYWVQRSRVKRRMNDLVLETKLTQLSNENEILRAKVDMLTRKFGSLSSEENTQWTHQSIKSTDQSQNNPSFCTTEHISLEKVLLNT